LLAAIPYPDSFFFSFRDEYITECSFLSKIHF
jgi:hypothetical protein